VDLRDLHRKEISKRERELPEAREESRTNPPSRVLAGEIDGLDRKSQGPSLAQEGQGTEVPNLPLSPYQVKQIFIENFRSVGEKKT